MATFLTTSKMSKELVARIDTSVRGGARPGARTPWKVAALRFGLAALVVGAIVWATVSYRRHDAAIETERVALLGALHAETADVTDGDRQTVARVEKWVIPRLDDKKDFVSDRLRGADRFSQELAAPTLYLRGPIDDFAKPDGVRAVAEQTSIDAFVLCLIDAPPSRTEKLLRQRARASRGATAASKAPRFELLASAYRAAPFFVPQWAARVHDAETLSELGRLRRDFEHAPIAPAKRAMKAERLLLVMDEPKTGKGPTEIDGACPHFVRVALIDLANDSVLLRSRKFVDPSWLSDDARAVDAAGVNDCELAMAVRAGVQGDP